MSHTPGPWHVKPPQFCGFNHAVVPDDDYVIAPDDDYVIAGVDILDNARLIAAAPELLDALKNASTCSSIPDAVMALIRSAIAKAEGRTP